MNELSRARVAPAGGSSLKQAFKAITSRLIRAVSFLFPVGLLFRLFCRVRRFHVWLLRKSAPKFLLKGIDHLFYSLRPELVTAPYAEGKLVIRLNDPCHYNHILGVHEPRVAEWLRRSVKPGMNVIDVGANIGTYTLLFARLVGAGGRVMGVEADPQVAEILALNVRVNALDNVDVVRGAAHSEAGRLRLGRATASSWFTGVYYQQAAEWFEVAAYPLDALVRERGFVPVHLVKIDVEGAELAVLEGMREILARDRPVVLVELHNYNVQGPVHPALGKLRDAGYEGSFLTDEHVVFTGRG